MLKNRFRRPKFFAQKQFSAFSESRSRDQDSAPACFSFYLPLFRELVFFKKRNRHFEPRFSVSACDRFSFFLESFFSKNEKTFEKKALSECPEIAGVRAKNLRKKRRPARLMFDNGAAMNKILFVRSGTPQDRSSR